MATINVKDAAGSTVALEKPLTPGQALMAASRPVVLASDQSSIPVAATLAAETTKVIGTVRTASGGIASGSVASGAVASGAYAAGSLAAGAGVDGWDLTQGAIADAAVTAGATGSISAKLRSLSRDIGSLVTALGSTALDLGSGTGGSRTLRVAIDSAQLDGSEYETVAASQTAQVLGATGGTGDFISGILVVPATTSPGNVLLLDNATSITVFAGGATSVSNLVPFFIPLGMFSVSGAWKITTGSNVSCIGIGNFT